MSAVDDPWYSSGGSSPMMRRWIWRSSRDGINIRVSLVLTSVLIGIASLSGCSVGSDGWAHGYGVRTYQGRLLSARDGAGADRLAVEKAYDDTIQDYVRKFGEPDYIYVVGRLAVQLIYLKDDRLVFFQRPALWPDSTATVTHRLPESLASTATRVWFPRCWTAEASSGRTHKTCTTCCRGDVDCKTTCESR